MSVHFFILQTKKLSQREKVDNASSSDSEDDKNTVSLSYKSSRTAVSLKLVSAASGIAIISHLESGGEGLVVKRLPKEHKPLLGDPVYSFNVKNLHSQFCVVWGEQLG